MLFPVFISPSTITPVHNKATQVFEKRIDNNEMVQDLRLKKLQELYEKQKLENEKKSEEERLKKESEKQKKNDNRECYNFVITYYALLQDECGKTDGITASGKHISSGMIASPKIFKFGTKLMIEGIAYTVEDRGSSKYIKVNNDGSIRLDVYVPRLPNESNPHYSKRVSNMGVKKAQGYVVK